MAEWEARVEGADAGSEPVDGRDGKEGVSVSRPPVAQMNVRDVKELIAILTG